MDVTKMYQCGTSIESQLCTSDRNSDLTNSITEDEPIFLLLEDLHFGQWTRKLFSGALVPPSFSGALLRGEKSKVPKTMMHA